MLQFALLQRKKPAVRLSNCFPFAVVCAFLLFSLSACQGSTAAPRWHWERAESGLPRQAIVTAVAGDPADFNQLWAGLYDTVGLATSRDGG